MRHKNADIAIEWYKDTSRVVQYFWNNQWSDWNWISNPHFSENCKWRLKPESKPDVVVYRFINARDMVCDSSDDANIKLIFDGETGKLKSAEVIDE